MLEYLVSILIDRWGICLMVQLVVSIRSSSGGGSGHSYTFHTILCVCCTKQVQVVIRFYRLGNDYNGNWFSVVVDIQKLGQLSTNLDSSQVLTWCRWLGMTYVDLAVQHPFLCLSAALCITYSTLLVKVNYLSVLTLARFSYLAITTGLLTLGAVILNWICEKITEAGFGKWLSHIVLRWDFL